MVAGRPMATLHVLEATGRLEHDKKRFEGRGTPDSDELGAPSDGLTAQEIALWQDRRVVFWWLREHHREAFANWVVVTAKLRDPDNRDNIDQFVKLVNLQAKLGRLIGADPSSDQKFGGQKPTGKAAFSGKL